MPRLLWSLVAVMLALLVAAPADIAFAQQPPGTISGPPPPSRGPLGFFDFLFGPRQFAPPPQARQPPPVSPRRSSRPTEPPLSVAQVTPKDPDARKILVVGDFAASGLAWGLDQSFAGEPKIAIVDKSNTASGLVREDYFDWNKQLPALLNQMKPAVVIVLIGANDRQQMRIGKDRLTPRSDAWEKAYVARVAGLVDTLKVYGRPFFWVSAPPMRLAAASDDMTYLNGLYKTAVTAGGGHYVDIWNGFTDDNGNYISSGPDVDGQQRSLRNSDGINFTRAGYLKLAFYVERELRKQTGIGSGAVDLLTSSNEQSQIEIGPDGVKRLVGPIISLSDPLPSASHGLAGGTDNPDPNMATNTPQYRLIVNGAAPTPLAGRADDFAWPPSLRLPKEAPSTAAAGEPPTSSAN